MADRCDAKVFQNGKPLMAVDTGPVGGAAIFEQWVQDLAAVSGQRVDWHYSGGVAQVLVLGDFAAALAAAQQTPLPDNMTVLRFFSEGASGLWRNGVTPAPGNAIAGFMDPLSGEQAFILEEKP